MMMLISLVKHYLNTLQIHNVLVTIHIEDVVIREVAHEGTFVMMH